MRNKKTTIVTMLLIAFMLTGCFADHEKSAKASAATTMSEAGFDGYTADENVKYAGAKNSESHQMIAKMRLLQYGMSTELEDYKDVYLVDMKNEAGDAITVVVVKEGGVMKSLLPKVE